MSMLCICTMEGKTRQRGFWIFPNHSSFFSVVSIFFLQQADELHTGFGGNLVSWRSKKQSVVSRSTAEAEYRAMSLVVSEVLWVRNLLTELNVLRNVPMRVWCDNKSTINIAYNPVQHDGTKHVEIDRFFIKEKLDSGIIELSHVNSGGQVADCLTKSLGVKECNVTCNKMGMIDRYHPS